MTPRERIVAALSHQSTDVVPFDFGGTNVTSINVGAYENLKAVLGIKEPTRWAYYIGQIPLIPEDVLRFFGGDVRYVHIPYPEPMPGELTRPVQVDEWGIEWTQGPTGLFYVGRPPLAGADSPSDLARFSWPDPAVQASAAGLAKAARRLRRETDCAVCLHLPAGIVHMTQNLRGFENWLIDVTSNVSFAEALLERVTENYLSTLELLLPAVGEDVDLMLIPDDFGVQNGPLISPPTYRRLIKPRHARILDAIRAHSAAKVLFHCCGSVYWALGDLVDIGIDGLNPVQTSAADMEPARLKREFGRHVCFWGGIDTQHTLPYGSSGHVRQEVRQRIEQLADGGGYVISAVHNILGEVPPRNVLAMAEAAHRFGGRSDGGRFRVGAANRRNSA